MTTTNLNRMVFLAISSPSFFNIVCVSKARGDGVIPTPITRFSLCSFLELYIYIYILNLFVFDLHYQFSFKYII